LKQSKKKAHKSYSNESVLGNITNHFKLEFQLANIIYKEYENINSAKLIRSKEALTSVKILNVYSQFVHIKHIISETMQSVTQKILCIYTQNVQQDATLVS
jgi:hypothetical protein